VDQYPASFTTRAAAAAVVAARIRQLGACAGLALSPGTLPDEAIALVLADAIDSVLVMSVEPGWGGQAFLAESTLPKLKKLRDTCGPTLVIQVSRACPLPGFCTAWLALCGTALEFRQSMFVFVGCGHLNRWMVALTPTQLIKL
jgi:hypothetical protein